MATNNEINQPRPAGFHAKASGIEADVTGDGTVYVLKLDNVLINDGNYDSATGLYSCSRTNYFGISISVGLIGMAAHSQASVRIFRTDGNSWKYPYTIGSVGFAPPSGYLMINGFIMYPFLGNLIYQFRVIVSGSTKTVSISEDTEIYCFNVSDF